MNQMRISTPKDWCTYARAAEILDVSIRQVMRYAEDPETELTVIIPQVGARESHRGKRLLLVDEVLAFKAARQVIGRG